ncbi:MAG: 2-C-methyl-D-erythritol 4-phosphate cytidylyltransferase [Candidatus Diapherotrites archaeon]|nr:2-C-methyl-D-erythritol 4-phosphate cytidylyltransferase [Candidatus Diapherotrites archaeon]
MSSEDKTCAIILASGVGSRMRWDRPKQFIKVAGKLVIEHTLDAFEASPQIDSIVVVVHRDWYHYFMDKIYPKYSKISKVVIGGSTRQESSYIGLVAAGDLSPKYVLIHDAVRPFVTDDLIRRVISALESGAVAVDTVIPATDTIVEVDGDRISNIPPRSKLRRGQTPQGFRYDVILRAHELAKAEKYLSATDDCSLVVRYDLGNVRVVPGDLENIKITYPLDVYLADKIFQVRTQSLIAHVSKEDILSALRSLDGHVVVVFGGTSGIGKAVVDIGKKFGAKVYVASRRTGVDISDYDSVKSYLSDIYLKEGRIDFVVNTAGILRMGKIVDMSLQDISHEVSVDFLGAVYVVKAFLEILSQKGDMQSANVPGIALFASSSYTLGRPNYSIYSASKAAVVNFAQAVSAETDLAKIFVVSPERTKTPLRERNFGKEPESTLLMPETVAVVTYLAYVYGKTGSVYDVRKDRDEIHLREICPEIFAGSNCG